MDPHLNPCPFKEALDAAYIAQVGNLFSVLANFLVLAENKTEADEAARKFRSGLSLLEVAYTVALTGNRQ